MDVGERYVLGRLVGEGATAHVYQAEDTVLQREVAVKVFRYPDIGDTRSRRIDEETRILASLAHPHLLPVYDSGRSADGHRFIVMPLVRGTTLAKLAARAPVAPREVKRIGKALAEALSHVHAAGIVHRDVKPSNVLLADDGKLHLADFGFAHAEDGPALTSTDCVVGTAGYLAPEQAEGQSVTPAVDVYALGLVLLEALTGERAYRGTPLERATANALRPPDIPARLGPGWLKVLRTLTARDPSARPTAAEIGGLVDVVEDELPEVTFRDATMELVAVDFWARPAPGVSEPVAAGASSYAVAAAGSGAAGSGATGSTAVDSAAAAGRPLIRRRLAALGSIAVVAAVVVGLGADLLTSGASADTRVPATTPPGAGAAGPPQATTPSRAGAVVPPGAASVSASIVDKATDLGTQTGTQTPSKRCQAGEGQNGQGHGKHKCQGH